MKEFHIDTDKLPKNLTEWGSLVKLADTQSAGTSANFSLALITYEKEHHSGVHDDTEYIFILEGSGKAGIAGSEIPFQKGSLLTVPAGTDHGISEVENAPVRALLIHVK